jgi:uncharacterized membrane protein (UPF0127 family)
VRRLPVALGVVGLLVMALAANCGAAGKNAPSPTASPAPPLVAAGPRVVMPSGAVYRLDLAKTPEEQTQGLMFRESLPDRVGMLFLFPGAGVHKFWMKNTMIPLDMIWLDGGGRVLFVNADTPPCRADPCPSYGPDGPAASVLEIAGGMAKREKVAVGETLKILEVR